MKKKLPFILLSLICAGVLFGYLLLRQTHNPDEIVVSGNIEVTDVSLGFKVAGRLAQCLVNEGDQVSKGDILARLEDEDQNVALKLAESNLAAARSVLEELKAGSRPEEIRQAEAGVQQARQTLLELTRGSRAQEIESAKAALEKALASEESAQSQFQQAASDLERFSKLYENNMASKRDFQLFQTQYDVALNGVKAASLGAEQARQAFSLIKEGPRPEQIQKAKAALIQAEAAYTLVKDGPRQEKIDQAAARVAEAQARVQQSQLALSYTRLISPMDGVVFSRSAEPGEFLNPATPVLVMGDLAHPWLRAYVSEKDLGRLKLKDEVSVKTDSFPDKTYPGVLSFISSEAEFTPKAVQTFEERVKLMFRIKIDLANPDGELRPGMPADAHILLRKK